MREQRPHFRLRQHRRHPLRPFGADHLVHPRELQAQHLAVKEQQRRQGLILRAGGDVPLDRQAGQEHLDLSRPEFARMTPAIGHDEPSYPAQVSPFGPKTVMPCPQPAGHFLQQARMPHHRSGFRYHPIPALIIHDHRIPCE